jgi:mannose-6-phosphate isomerase-like protein (cupin superfamily)
MYVKNKTDVPKRNRYGLTSHFMLQTGDIDESQLAVTWVDVMPGKKQRTHHHPPEQVFLIIAGKGRMHLGDETREVKEGDLVYIPTNLPHSIDNLGDGILSYISAATPQIDFEEVYDHGELQA